MAIYKFDGVDGVLATPNKFIEVFCSSTVTRGDVVVLALDGNFGTNGLTVAKAGATANLSRACGVAMETLSTANNFVQIQYAGLNELATAESGSGGITVNGLVGTAATAGKIEDFTGATAVTGAVAPFAICARAYTAGAADGAIIIFDKGYFNG